MSRPPTIWFREQTGWYMTTIRGTQHKLARTEPAARKAFYKLMAEDAPAAERRPDRHSARWLCDKFLDRTKADKEPETWKVQLFYLKAFCEKFGKREATSLKAHEVNEWLDAGSWGVSSKALCITIIKAVFNWAVEEDYLSESPLKKLKRRKVARRERVLTAGERELLLGTAKGCFLDFLTVLAQTGMRPYSEAARLEASMVEWGEGRATLVRHKNAKKGKKRIVYFPPETLSILKRLADEHPTGLLLRNTRGKAWGKYSVHDRLKRLCDYTGVPHCTAYVFRHSYITDALIRGVPVEVVAELVGTSPKMIHDHYSSIDKNADALRAAAVRAIT